MFEWDEKKEATNIAKHGIDFLEAQSAFFDPRRVVAVDQAHCKKESRFFCIGRVEGGGILTVRFICRGDRIRIIGAGYWRKGKKLYEKANH